MPRHKSEPKTDERVLDDAIVIELEPQCALARRDVAHLVPAARRFVIIIRPPISLPIVMYVLHSVVSNIGVISRLNT